MLCTMADGMRTRITFVAAFRGFCPSIQGVNRERRRVNKCISRYSLYTLHWQTHFPFIHWQMFAHSSDSIRSWWQVTVLAKRPGISTERLYKTAEFGIFFGVGSEPACLMRKKPLAAFKYSWATAAWDMSKRQHLRLLSAERFGRSARERARGLNDLDVSISGRI